MSKKSWKNTSFWDDTYVADLDPIEKLLFGYLLDNPQTTLLGVYELRPRKMAFDTGIDIDMVKKVLDRFAKDNKIVLIDGGWICLVNRAKHVPTRQNMDSPTAKGIVREYSELPKHVADKLPYEYIKGVTSYWGTVMLKAWGIEDPIKGLV